MSKARGYAYAKIEYVSVRTYLSKNRIRVWYVSYAKLNSPCSYQKRIRPVQLHIVHDAMKDNRVTKFNWIDRFVSTQSNSKLIRTVAKNQFAVSAIIVCLRILFLFTYAKIEYVSVRTYLSENRIRTLRILEPWLRVKICGQSPQSYRQRGHLNPSGQSSDNDPSKSSIARTQSIAAQMTLNTQIKTLIFTIGVGDGGTCPPFIKIWENDFCQNLSCKIRRLLDKYHAKVGNFGFFSGKYHLKFEHFVNFSC